MTLEEFAQFIDALMVPELCFLTDIASVVIPLATTYLEMEIVPICFMAIMFAILGMKNTNEKLEQFSPDFKTGIVTVVLLLFSIISLSGVSTFLYFNF